MNSRSFRSIILFEGEFFNIMMNFRTKSVWKRTSLVPVHDYDVNSQSIVWVFIVASPDSGLGIILVFDVLLA